MLRASKTYKGWSQQGSWRSPLEGVAKALRGALLLRERPRVPFPPQDVCSPCVHGILKPQQQILRAEICVREGGRRVGVQAEVLLAGQETDSLLPCLPSHLLYI